MNGRLGWRVALSFFLGQEEEKVTEFVFFATIPEPRRSAFPAYEGVETREA